MQTHTHNFTQPVPLLNNKSLNSTTEYTTLDYTSMSTTTTAAGKTSNDMLLKEDEHYV